ncbi:MAG TPA: hypothetical protein VEL47_05750 [Myxococcota bacterium]|nr:hypothetical protein [Myxococcota bacterium]
MNWLFRRHFWLVHLVFLCIIAAIAAKTITTLAGYWLSKSVPEKPSALPIEEAPEEILPKDYSIANERNLFAAKREQISLTEEMEANEVSPGRWQDATRSSLPLKLVSTMVFRDPYKSRALILNTSTGQTHVHSVGECEPYRKSYDPRTMETVLPEQEWVPERACNNIENMATLKRIEEFRVVIFNERDRKYEYLSLLDEEKMPRFERLPSPMEEESDGVEKVGPTSYQIKRKRFDKALSDIGRLLTEARAVPKNDSKGNFIGFEIVYLKEGSLFEKIGIEKMDLLTRINGYDLDSPEKALQLFGKLRTADQFTIDLKRGDRSVTLDYSVVR